MARRYSNRPDLLQQLRKVVAIVSDGGQHGGTGAEVGPESVILSRRLRDRFSPEDLQTMIDLYTSGTTAKQVPKSSMSVSVASKDYYTSTGYADMTHPQPVAATLSQVRVS